MASIPMMAAEEGRAGVKIDMMEEEGSAPKQNAGSRDPKRMGLGAMGSFFDDQDEFLSGSSVAAAQIAIRMGFLRKVFGLLSVQLTITTIFSAVVVLTPGAKGLVQGWPSLMMIGFFASIAMLIAMMVKRHDTPINYILLAGWTIVQSYTVAACVTFYDVDVVIQALFLTCAVVIGLFIYTLQTTRDFTSMGAGITSALLILIVASFAQLFIMSSTMELFISIGGAAIFSLFIIFDLQMMMYKLSPDEYILATINLYLDIINLFLYILRILQAANRN